MKLIKDEDIALAIQPGWLLKVKDEWNDIYYSGVYKSYDDIYGPSDGDPYELVFEINDVLYNVIYEGAHYDLQANLDPQIMAVYKLSKRGNFIKVWERD